MQNFNLKNKIKKPLPYPLSLRERGIKGVRAVLLLFALCTFSFALSAYAVPIITNVEPTSISDTTFVVTWTTTNESSSTELLWGAGGLTNVTTVAGTTKFHRVELTGLYQSTNYQYRVKSGSSVYPPTPLFSPQSFDTLVKPSGEYLFSFAVMNDLRYAEGKTSTQNAMGIPYQYCKEIISSEVNDISNWRDPNNNTVAFTVINGNLVEGAADAAGTKYGDQANSKIKPIIDLLPAKASDLTSNIGYKYLPVPGTHDKQASYTTDWITNSFKPLTANTSIESVYGYNAASKDADSVFNYQFKYKYYNFIFLDSVLKPNAVKTNVTGSANLSNLYSLLSAESNSKTFIFMSYPAYDPRSINGEKDYPVDVPTTEVAGGLCIANDAAFRSTIEAFKDSSGNKIVAAVIAGQLGDNYKRDINGVSYIRQGPAQQYPTGYSIYKVYSTGYMKTFYKTTARDATDKPYFEYARDQISAEAVSGQTLSANVLTQFWLGTSTNRNFTYSYAFIPGVSPKVISTAPSSAETAVSLNGPVLINFNKRMQAASDLADWVSIKDSNNNTIAVSAASFIDASRTILKVSHTDFASEETFTATVNALKAKDEGLTTMEANYSFTFDTKGGKRDDNPPSATITPLPSNTTTDPFPNFTGIASDDSRVIVVEYRFDNTGSWGSTEAVDGEFTGTTEVFQVKPSSPLSTGSHSIWLRTSDGAGNTSAEGFSAYTFNVVVGEKPTSTSFKANGNTIYSGDSISATPKFEITISSNSSLESGRITIDSVQTALSFVKVDTNYYATHEVTTALADGTHVITVEAFDVNGNATTFEANPLMVKSVSAAAVQGTPMNYPNPFDPGTQSTAIGYSLTKASDIILTVHDTSGTVVARKTYTSDNSGGRAGYNEVTWDGKSDTGDYVGNGIYLYLIIADGKVVAKGKLTVLKR